MASFELWTLFLLVCFATSLVTAKPVKTDQFRELLDKLNLGALPSKDFVPDEQYKSQKLSAKTEVFDKVHPADVRNQILDQIYRDDPTNEESNNEDKSERIKKLYNLLNTYGLPTTDSTTGDEDNVTKTSYDTQTLANGKIIMSETEYNDLYNKKYFSYRLGTTKSTNSQLQPRILPKNEKTVKDDVTRITNFDFDAYLNNLDSNFDEPDEKVAVNKSELQPRILPKKEKTVKDESSGNFHFDVVAFLNSLNSNYDKPDENVAVNKSELQPRILPKNEKTVKDDVIIKTNFDVDGYLNNLDSNFDEPDEKVAVNKSELQPRILPKNEETVKDDVIIKTNFDVDGYLNNLDSNFDEPDEKVAVNKSELQPRILPKNEKTVKDESSGNFHFDVVAFLNSLDSKYDKPDEKVAVNKNELQPRILPKNESFTNEVADSKTLTRENKTSNILLDTRPAPKVNSRMMDKENITRIQRYRNRKLLNNELPTKEEAEIKNVIEENKMTDNNKVISYNQLSTDNKITMVDIEYNILEKMMDFINQITTAENTNDLFAPSLQSNNQLSAKKVTEEKTTTKNLEIMVKNKLIFDISSSSENENTLMNSDINYLKKVMDSVDQTVSAKKADNLYAPSLQSNNQLSAKQEAEEKTATENIEIMNKDKDTFDISSSSENESILLNTAYDGLKKVIDSLNQVLAAKKAHYLHELNLQSNNQLSAKQKTAEKTATENIEIMNKDNEIFDNSSSSENESILLNTAYDGLKKVIDLLNQVLAAEKAHYLHESNLISNNKLSVKDIVDDMTTTEGVEITDKNINIFDTPPSTKKESILMSRNNDYLKNENDMMDQIFAAHNGISYKKHPDLKDHHSANIYEQSSDKIYSEVSENITLKQEQSENVSTKTKDNAADIISWI